MLIEKILKYFLSFASIFAVLGGLYAKGKADGKNKASLEESKGILNRVRSQNEDNNNRANDDIDSVRNRLRKDAIDR